MSEIELVKRLRNATGAVSETALCAEAADAIEALTAALKKATHELNAIRARDGAPQHIDWYRGQPIQTDGCTKEYWDELTEQCFAALRKVRP